MTQWTKPGSYRERAGGKTKIQGMKMEQQKNKKGHHKNENFEFNQKKKHIQQSNKSGKMKKQNQFLVISQHHNKQTHKCFFVSKLFICTHSEPGRKTKRAVHVWLHVCAVGSEWRTQATTLIKDTSGRPSSPHQNGLEWLPRMTSTTTHFHVHDMLWPK